MPKILPPPKCGQCPVFHGPDDAGASFKGRSVVCIGTFDGVHRGHQAILARGHALAAANGHRLLVVTFHPHPKSVVAPQKAPLLLCDPFEKATMLAAYGAEGILQLRFDRELAATPAAEFLNTVLAKPLRPAAIVFGDDFRLGRGREGDPDFLRRWGVDSGCQVELVEQVIDNDLNSRIGSSLIRQLLADGQFDMAVRLLGHAYPVSGPIKTGAGRGKKIGYPTWNLQVPEYKLPPPVGIYAGWAGRTTPRPAMAYYGSNPTFGGHGNYLEANLIGVEGNATPAREETIWLGAFVRQEVKFESADALISQLADDQRVVTDMLSTATLNHQQQREK